LISFIAFIMLSSTDKSRIVIQLRQFGCSNLEAEIYLQSLQVGPASVQEVSQKLKKNRVTVHSAMRQLVDKGFLFETKKGKKRLLVAEEPIALFRILQKKKNDLDLMETHLDHVVKLLNSVQIVDRGQPTVRMYEGVDGFKKMLEESLTARGEVLVFTYVDIFSEILDPNYLENYFKRRAKKGIHTRLIFPPCKFANRVYKKAKQYNIRVRLLPPELKWASGFFSWNDCVALMSYTEGRLTCTIIENKDIVYFIRKIMFELIWSHCAYSID
jgi:sugar-specific transcriptional regulator TrmB